MLGTLGENALALDVLAGYGCINTPCFVTLDKLWFCGPLAF